MRLALLTCGLLLAAQPLAAEEKPKLEEGFVSLFDGSSLEGWQGNFDVFHLRDGAIVGGSLKKDLPRNEFLTAKKEYGDFELRLQFKLLGGTKANAGVQIRSQRIPNHHEMIGYQADLADGYWGCLYDESRRRKILAGPEPEDRGKVVKKDDWNDYRILCEGRRIRLLDQRPAHRRLHGTGRSDPPEGSDRPTDPRRPAQRSVVSECEGEGAMSGEL